MTTASDALKPQAAHVGTNPTAVPSYRGGTLQTQTTRSDIQIRDGITFEWLDDPSMPNPRWRARMSRQVFAALVKEKLGADHGSSFLTAPPRRRPK
jgi:hypothetical protein